MSSKTKAKKPAAEKKAPAPQPAPPANDPRVSPVTRHPRNRIIRVTVTECWGAEYIKGRGKTFRIYPVRYEDSISVRGLVNRYLDQRCLAVQKELDNENPNSAAR